MNLPREVAAALVLTALLPAASFAQQAAAPTAPTSAAGVAGSPSDASDSDTAEVPAQLPANTAAIEPQAVILPAEDRPAPKQQPSAATPPTPLPTRRPDPKIAGITAASIKQANLFNADHLPGQPLAGDPATIRTLQDAIDAALARNPTVLLAQENVLHTRSLVNGILALRSPQISTSATYTRLANSSSSAGFGGGITPASIANPFGVGLPTTPPGSSPIVLSTAVDTTGGVGSSSSTGASTPAPASAGPSSVSTSTISPAAVQLVPVGGAGAPSEISRAAGTPVDSPRQTTTSTPGFSISATNLNQASANISVSQLIDITGILHTAIQVGDLEDALSQLELAQARQQITLSVTTAYYSVLKALSLVRVSEAAVADGVELLRITNALKRAGVDAEFDVLEARTQLENSRQALISSRNQAAIAKDFLANLIGLDPSTPIDPQPVDVPPLPSLDEESLVEQAYKQRPEYLESDINILLAQKNVRLARRTLEPYMSAAVSGQYNATPYAFAAYKATGSLGLSLTVPLYDGGATRAQVEAARSNEREALVTKDQYARGVKSEVQQAIVAVKDADARSLEIAATVGEAREAVRLANVRLKAGISTQLDVYQAEAALVQAEDNQVNALYDYLGALATLARAVGTPR